jgi:hypothetical protein
MEMTYTIATINFIENKVALSGVVLADPQFLKLLCQAWKAADRVGGLDFHKVEIEKLLHPFLLQYVDKIVLGNRSF